MTRSLRGRSRVYRPITAQQFPTRGSTVVAPVRRFCETFGTVDGYLGTPGPTDFDFGPPTAGTDHDWWYSASDDVTWAPCSVVDGQATTVPDFPLIGWAQNTDVPFATHDVFVEFDWIAPVLAVNEEADDRGFVDVGLRIGDTGESWGHLGAPLQYIDLLLGTQDGAATFSPFWAHRVSDDEVSDGGLNIGSEVAPFNPGGGTMVGRWRFECEADLTVRVYKDSVLRVNVASTDWFSEHWDPDINGYVTDDPTVFPDWDGTPGFILSATGAPGRVTIDNFCWGDLRDSDFVPIPPTGVVYTESFNKADGALGPDLSWTATTATAIGVTGNQLAPQSTAPSGADDWAVAQHDTATTDQYAQIDWISQQPVASDDLQFWLRCDDAASDYVMFEIHTNSDHLDIGYGPSVSTSFDGVVAGSTWRAEISGTTATLLRDGVSMLSTDITGLGGDTAAFNRCGILLSTGGATANTRLDNFEFGDL